jgi:hypothetical protein
LTAMNLQDALPIAFGFYHLGHVEMNTVPESSLAEKIAQASWADDFAAVAFRLHGERKHVLVMLFDKDLDASAYTEMGNVIASRAAMRLSETGAFDCAISPPQSLTPLPSSPRKS